MLKIVMEYDTVQNLMKCKVGRRVTTWMPASICSSRRHHLIDTIFTNSGGGRGGGGGEGTVWLKSQVLSHVSLNIGSADLCLSSELCPSIS